MRLLACIDGSAYAPSVCEHAAWFADRTGASIEVLHALDDEEDMAARLRGGDGGPWSSTDGASVQAAEWRLKDLGMTSVVGRTVRDAFPRAAVTSGADMIVVGKRGLATQDDRGALGSSIDTLVRSVATPICLAPKVYLPISRALVLLDADMRHRAALDLLAALPNLAADQTDVLVIGSKHDDPQPKAALARATLRAGVSIEPARAPSLDAAVTRRMEASAAADLIIVSRAVLLPALQAQLRTIETSGLWGWRTPMLIC